MKQVEIKFALEVQCIEEYREKRIAGLLQDIKCHLIFSDASAEFIALRKSQIELIKNESLADLGQEIIYDATDAYWAKLGVMKYV